MGTKGEKPSNHSLLRVTFAFMSETHDCLMD